MVVFFGMRMTIYLLGYSTVGVVRTLLTAVTWSNLMEETCRSNGDTGRERP